MAGKMFEQIIEKLNPYHGSDGRFSTAEGAASFTYKPGASTAHDNAIAREKERTGSAKGFKGTLYHGSPATDIEEFDMGLAGRNTSSGEKLLFFTDSKQMADDFSYERLDGSSKFMQRRGKKGRVYEVDVEIKKPLDLRNLSEKDLSNLMKLDVDGILTREIAVELSGKNNQLLKTYLDLTAESLIGLGYDGLIAHTGKAGHNSIEYAVVDSKQARIRKGVAKSFAEILKGNSEKQKKAKSLIERWQEDDHPIRAERLDVRKFNDNHDPKTGQFAPKGGAGGAGYGITSEQQEKLTSLIQSGAIFSAVKYKKEIGMDDDEFKKLKESIQGKKETKPKVEPKPQKKPELSDESKERISRFQAERQAKIDALAEACGVDQEKAKEYFEALDGWTGGDYIGVRALQSGRISDYPYYTRDDIAKTKKQAEAIEAFINDAPPYEGTLYRGIGADVSQFKVGGRIDMGGTSSWSSSKDMAEDFAMGEGGGRNSVVLISTKKISKAAGIESIMQTGEDEVLVSESVKYDVKKIMRSGRIDYVYVEEAADTIGKSFAEILKANPYHDPSNGRFTTGPGGGGAWAESMEAEKASVMAMKPAKRAMYVLDHDGETYDNCVAAMQNGETEALVNNYFAVMAANGDPTPTKPVSDQLDGQIRQDVEGSKKYSGYEEARTQYIKDMSGLDDDQAQATMKEFQKWFGGSWDDADTATLDKYIEEDHAFEGTMYRGMKFDHDGFDAFMKDIGPGAQIRMQRNSSWSSDEEVARSFGAHIYNDVDTVMITCVKNRTSAPVAHLSTAGESEVLAHSKASWTVLHSEVVQWPSGAKKAYLTVVETGE